VNSLDREHKRINTVKIDFSLEYYEISDFICIFDVVVLDLLFFAFRRKPMKFSSFNVNKFEIYCLKWSYIIVIIIAITIILINSMRKSKFLRVTFRYINVCIYTYTYNTDIYIFISHHILFKKEKSFFVHNVSVSIVHLLLFCNNRHIV